MVAEEPGTADPSKDLCGDRRDRCLGDALRSGEASRQEVIVEREGGRKCLETGPKHVSLAPIDDAFDLVQRRQRLSKVALVQVEDHLQHVRAVLGGSHPDDALRPVFDCGFGSLPVRHRRVAHNVNLRRASAVPKRRYGQCPCGPQVRAPARVQSPLQCPGQAAVGGDGADGASRHASLSSSARPGHEAHEDVAAVALRDRELMHDRAAVVATGIRKHLVGNGDQLRSPSQTELHARPSGLLLTGLLTFRRETVGSTTPG